MISVAIEPKTKSDQEKLRLSLDKLFANPTFEYIRIGYGTNDSLGMGNSSEICHGWCEIR